MPVVLAGYFGLGDNIILAGGILAGASVVPVVFVVLVVAVVGFFVGLGVPVVLAGISF